MTDDIRRKPSTVGTDEKEGLLASLFRSSMRPCRLVQVPLFAPSSSCSSSWPSRLLGLEELLVCLSGREKDRSASSLRSEKQRIPSFPPLPPSSSPSFSTAAPPFSSAAPLFPIRRDRVPLHMGIAVFLRFLSSAHSSTPYHHYLRNFFLLAPLPPFAPSPHMDNPKTSIDLELEKHEVQHTEGAAASPVFANRAALEKKLVVSRLFSFSLLAVSPTNLPSTSLQRKIDLKMSILGGSCVLVTEFSFQPAHLRFPPSLPDPSDHLYPELRT